MKKLLAIALACALLAPGVSAQKKTQPSWLSDAVFYQIYPLRLSVVKLSAISQDFLTNIFRT